MDKFGSLFNVSIGDLPQILNKLGLGVGSDKDGRRSAQQLNKLAHQQHREWERFNKRLNDIGGELDDDIHRKMTEMSNSMRLSYQESKKQLEERLIEDELRKTGIFTKTLDTIKDLKRSGVLNKFSDFALGKGLVASVGGVIGVFSSNFQALNTIIDDTGYFSTVVLDNFMAMRREMEVMNKLGEDFNVTSSTHLKLATNLSKTHGDVSDASVSTLDSIANLEYVLAVSNEEAVEFLNTMRGITGASIETNLELIKTTAILGSREGIPFRVLMEDISSNAEFFAGNMGKGNKEMLKGVVYARKIGIELSTLTGVLDSFSNLENVIESSMQLSLITGRQINFLQSASDAFFGNTESAIKSLLSEVAKMDDTTFDIPFVRKQFAEQIGVNTTELVKMRQAVKEIGVESALVEFGFSDELATFDDIMSGFGFRKLGIEAQRHILQPINSAMDRHLEQADSVFNFGASIIEKIGDFTEWYFDKLGISGTILPAVAGGFIKLTTQNFAQNALLTMQLNELRQIKMGVGASFFGKGGIGRGLGKGLGITAGIGGVATGMGMSYSATKNNESPWGGILTGILSGAGTGALATGANPIGIGVGALLGGLSAGLPAMIGTGLSSGGIATKEILQPIAERNQKEAVIPLDSSRGKEMMELSLSEDSINKLVEKMVNSGLSPNINFSYNGRKVDDSEKFFEMIATSK